MTHGVAATPELGVQWFELLTTHGFAPLAWAFDMDKSSTWYVVETARTLGTLEFNRELFALVDAGKLPEELAWRTLFVAPGAIAVRNIAHKQRPERRVYVSGPMRGYPDNNYPLFHRVAAEQRALGYEVCSPAEYDDGSKPFVLREAMAYFCKYICEEATHILMLPGWQASMGATTEYNLARNCNLVVDYHSAAASAVTVSDLHAVVPARTVQAYLATYLNGWEAGGCVERPIITVRPSVNEGGYEIKIHHLET